jgi:hypothetical protein
MVVRPFDAGSRQEIRGCARKNTTVNAHDRLVRQVAVEEDDLLATLQLVHGDDELETHLFDQLVDLLVEQLFLDLRRRHADGELARDEYVAELGTLAHQCRAAGLLPLPGRDA